MVFGQWTLRQQKEDLKNMKILELIFDSKLNWYHQTVTAIEKANKA